jgi:1-deoxy-D-xylulose-5-phosphate synthase
MKPIQGPADLRKLSLSDLEALAQEIRQVILTTCLKNGGHLGASLGTVELAIALHTAFESPIEPIIWDVGHQAYAHKLLTGRWDRFSTLRLPGGISGFLSREESEHDVFGAGHSSTSISAALAMSWEARHHKTEKGNVPWTVAVIGDGGLTAGISFEALNNFRETQTGPFLLVINDNQMSISQNSGAVPAILAGDQTSDYFGLFGFDYWGPVDGHDLNGLLGTLNGIRKTGGTRPIALHVITQKGKGYAPAEELPSTYHGIGPVKEKAHGAAITPEKKTYSEVAGDAICAVATKNEKVVAVTAAMKEGTGLSKFADQFPDRFFDVGIAEPHAVTFAAGLATKGVRPVVCIYSTFLQRALDSIIHDVAIQKLPVTFAIDRAGIVGADGPTHHGAFDLAYLGMIPGMRISTPECLADVAHLFERANHDQNGPWAIRYPRGGGPETISTPLSAGAVRWHQKPAKPKLIVVALGSAAVRAKEAVAELDPKAERITLVSSIDAKPIPDSILIYLKENSAVPLMTVEDGVAHGGFGSTIVSALSGRSATWDIAAYGDHFIPHGTPAGLEESEGLNRKKLLERMQRLLS